MAMLTQGLAVKIAQNFPLGELLFGAWKLQKESCEGFCWHSQVNCIPFCLWPTTFCDALLTFTRSKLAQTI